jgi:phosphonopyruvate decarboxylase
MKCEDLWDIFEKEGLTFFTGVPDSTFNDWMKFLADRHGQGLENIVACNECEAVAIAAGHHLATGGLAVVYMQNAGLGKAVNPLTSLADPEVYSIPMILMIGWRGEPGVKDEPQHRKMGRIMLPLLDVLEVPHAGLPGEKGEAARVVREAASHALEHRTPYALIVKKGVFEQYDPAETSGQDWEMSREDAIAAILDALAGEDVIISTTGKTSREVYEYREAHGQGHHSDFLTVGSMGCSPSIALGVALGRKDRRVLVLDGDGALIMQEGAMSTIGHYRPPNLYHMVFDNQAYDSTGGQPTTSPTVHFERVALASSYRGARTVYSREDLVAAAKDMLSAAGPRMLIVKVRKGARKDLGRPATTPVENKKAFMHGLEA